MQRAPKWVIGLGAGFLWVVLMLSGDFLRGEPFEPLKAAITAIFGALFGAFIVGFTSFRQRRDRDKPSGSPTTSNLQTAVSTGRLPEGAMGDEWIRELARIARQERHLIWGGPLFMGVFVAMAVYLIFDDPAHPFYGGILGAAFLGMAVWFPFWIRLRRARIHKLIAELEDKPPAQ